MSKSKLKTYRLIFSDGTEYLIKAATKRGAQRIFTNRYGMRKMLNLKFVDLVEGEGSNQ